MVPGVIAPPSQWYDLTAQYFERNGWPLGLLAVLTALLKAAVILAFIALNVLFLIWLERKVSAWIQNRLGPMRTGPWGLLQTLADALKLLLKEDVVPSAADRWVFAIAPIVTFTPAVLIFVVLPFSDRWIVQDLNIGILFVAAMTSMVVPSFLMAGWGSNNKWSVFGALRSAAQLVSYEVPLVLAAVAVVLLAGSLSLNDIVEAQRRSGWFILVQPLGFLVYYIAALAEANRAPFDLIEAESELVAGFMTEYSSLKFALFMLSEYVAMVTMSAVTTTLFLGGWRAPWPITLWGDANSGWWPMLWFLGKVLLLVFVFVWLRGTLPRLRYDQFMRLGWKVLLPINLVWILLLAGIRTLQKEETDSTVRNLIIAGTVLAVLLVTLLWPSRKQPPRRPLQEQVDRRPPGSFPLPPMDLQVPPSPRVKRAVAQREPANAETAEPANVGAASPSAGPGQHEKEV